MATSGSVTATCPSGDPAAADTTLPSDCQSKSTFYVAWGTELNQQESISSGAIDLDLYLSRSLDFGETYETPVVVALGGVDLDNDESSNGESQIRMTPDGSASYVSWMKSTSDGKELAFISGDFKTVDLGLETDGGGFCSYNPRGRFDPVLPGILLMALAYLGWRRGSCQS